MGEDDVGTDDGKKSWDMGGYEEYDRGAPGPARFGETRVVLRELRTLAASSLLKWDGRR